MSQPVPVVDPPNLDGFTTFYGIQVSTIGEDGNLIALGHHDERRVLAAFLTYHRKVIGEPIPLYHNGHTLNVEQMWGELLGRCGDCPDPILLGVCDRCDHAARGLWFMTWHDKPQPGTFPITMLEM